MTAFARLLARGRPIRFSRTLLPACALSSLAFGLPLAAHAQDVGDALDASTTIVVQLIDLNTNQPIPNVDLSISPLPDPVNGGHVTGHTAQRVPTYMGTLSANSCNTGGDGNGCVVVFTSKHIGGRVRVHMVYTLNGTRQTRDTPNAVTVSAIGGDELASVAGRSPSYNLVGETSTHPSNHFCQEGFCQKLVTLGDAYLNQWDLSLAYNDSSLLKGGVFDVNNDWMTPHSEHDFGVNQDVRANGGDSSIPFDDTIRTWFVNKVIEIFGQAPLHEDTGTSNEHYHIRG